MVHVNTNTVRVYPVDYMFQKVERLSDLLENEIIKTNEKVEQKAEQIDLTGFNARLENLVVNAGDLSNNAELLDFRLDSDGNTYSTGSKRVAAIENKLFSGIYNIPIQWEVGSIQTGDGNNGALTTSLRTKTHIPFDVGTSLKLGVETGYKVLFYFYDINKTFVTISTFYTADTTITINYPYIKIVIQQTTLQAATSDYANHATFKRDYRLSTNLVGYNTFSPEKLKTIQTNLFNAFNFTYGYFDATGAIVSSTAAGRSDFIEVPDGVKFVSTNYATTGFCLVAFDANKNILYINDTTHHTNGYNTMEILNNVKYVVCQWFGSMHANILDWVFVWGNTVPDITTNKYEYANGYQPKGLIVGRSNGTNEVLANLDNPLYGKTVIWDGDSIMNGTSTQDTSGLKGWTGRIAKNNFQTYKNYSVGGATISAVVAGRHWISRSIDAMFAEYPNADYVVFDGGTNDADNNIPMGTISTGYGAALDDTTFIGAMESVCKQLITKYPTKKIGYIIPHKMGDTDTVRNLRRSYYDQAILVCKKWGIPYIDLWFGSHICYNVTPQFMVDTQHLNTAGYDLISPKIEAWMKTI